IHTSFLSLHGLVIPAKAGIHSRKWRGSAILDARFRGHDEFAVYRQRDSNFLKNKTNSRYVNPITLAGEGRGPPRSGGKGEGVPPVSLIPGAGFLRQQIEEGAHHAHGEALLEADGELRALDLDAADGDRVKALVVPELAREDDAETEPRGDRLAHGLAAADLERLAE